MFQAELSSVEKQCSCDRFRPVTQKLDASTQTQGKTALDPDEATFSLKHSAQKEFIEKQMGDYSKSAAVQTWTLRNPTKSIGLQSTPYGVTTRNPPVNQVLGKRETYALKVLNNRLIQLVYELKKELKNKEN